MEGGRRRMPTIEIWIFAILMVLGPAASIDDKCSACKAVAAEIEHGLSSEKPRNHLDMRHRLDSKGQRKGKVIDYKVSELRVVELLDDLCDKMQEYTLQKSDSGKQEWVRVTDWDSLESDKREARAHSKAISSYCGRLLDETEDELAASIKGGSIETGQVSKVLCQELSKHCSLTSCISIFCNSKLGLGWRGVGSQVGFSNHQKERKRAFSDAAVLGLLASI